MNSITWVKLGNRAAINCMMNIHAAILPKKF
jgi:hypothetical protein